MKSKKQFPLQGHNSFNIKTICSNVYFPSTIAELELLPDLSESDFYILGEGSNTLFVEQYAPVIIKPDFKGITVSETHENYIVRVGAAENWHEFVCFCLNRNMFGLENLALIPGSVGAAPVQNIGAYGVEFSDFCLEVKWFELSSKSIKTLNNVDCQFSYRNSAFKKSLYNKGLITEVVFGFPKKWQANLSYAGLDELPLKVSANKIMEKVISLRQTKLPSPDELPNAGSFFKNPIVDNKKLNSLKELYPDMPFYRQNDAQSKLAAGWLIEQAGLKGYRKDGVGVHKQQALVLVNYSSTNGNDILLLAKYVQEKVFEKFKIILAPEVRMVTERGEQKFANFKFTQGCE